MLQGSLVRYPRGQVLPSTYEPPLRRGEITGETNRSTRFFFLLRFVMQQRLQRGRRRTETIAWAEYTPSRRPPRSIRQRLTHDENGRRADTRGGLRIRECSWRSSRLRMRRIRTFESPDVRTIPTPGKILSELTRTIATHLDLSRHVPMMNPAF
jgi:hypothetical protein